MKILSKQPPTGRHEYLYLSIYFLVVTFSILFCPGTPCEEDLSSIVIPAADEHVQRSVE